jgi:glycosyltransferase involved in cell wall biosynthesis
MTKKILQIGIDNFNPLLCDGVSGSMFDLYCDLKNHDCEVTICNFYSRDNYKEYVFNYLLKQTPDRDITDKSEHCHTVKFHGFKVYQHIFPWGGHELASRAQEVLKIMYNRLCQEKADVIVTVECSISALLAASMLKIPGCHFFHSLDYMKTFSANNNIYTKLLKDRTVFVVSRYMQQMGRKILGMDSIVWNPVINLKKYRHDSCREKEYAIGYYSGGKHKGDEIVNKLFSKMPEYQFFIMGRCYTRQTGIVYSNLTYLGDTTDIKEFYGKIDLLLVPSIAEEAFTRVSIEAAVNGIPVIANNVGGIPEALGDSGILIDVDLNERIDTNALADKYVYHIKRLLNNNDIYEHYRNRALQRASEYEEEQEKMLVKFCDMYIQ